MSQPLVAEEAKSGTAPELARDVGEQRPPLIPTEDLAGRSHFWDAKLSPDGKLLAYLRQVNGETVITVSDIDSNRIVTQAMVPKNNDLKWYRWAGSDRLLVSLSSMGEFFEQEVPYTRLLLMFPHQGTAEILFPKNRAVVGDDVIFVAKDGSYALVAVQKTIYDYPSVYRYQLQHEGDVTIVQKPIDGVWDWYADDAGVVRMGTGWRSKKLRIHYRPDGESK
ncbi:MAG: hypothetical protein EP350_04720, partial [Alphaproteobacteria bacterium]